MSDHTDYSQIFIDDGLGVDAPARYRSRRRHMAALFDGPCVIPGIDHPPAHQNTWAHLSYFLYQEPLFLYLTGINQPGCVLVLDPNLSEDPGILFVPKRNPDTEFWDGVRFGTGDIQSDAMIQELTGHHRIEHRSRLNAVVRELVRSDHHSHLWMPWHVSHSGPKRTLRNHLIDSRKRLQQMLRRNQLSCSIENMFPQAWAQLFNHDPADIDCMRHALSLMTEGFNSVLSRMSSFSSETELSAALLSHLNRLSYYGPSFPPIVAGGKNATVLHYTKNNSPLVSGDLVLMDFGVRWHSMAGDLSRTIPVNGTFDPLQALLYDIVLDAQLDVEAHARAGSSLMELNTRCWDQIDQLLEDRFLSKGGRMVRHYSTAPHYVGHYIGIAVHDGDPFQGSRSQTLVAGSLITNEPGLYGHFDITIDGVRYSQDIGIRIEDVLLITDTGCENLSENCPKQRAEIESLMGR